MAVDQNELDPKFGEDVLFKTTKKNDEAADMLFAGITKHDASWEREAVEITTLNEKQNGKRYKLGKFSGSGSAEVNYIAKADDPTKYLDYYALMKIFKKGDRLTFYCGGTETGESYEEFTGFVKSINRSFQAGAIVTGSISFQYEGEPEIKEVPAAE